MSRCHEQHSVRRCHQQHGHCLGLKAFQRGRTSNRDRHWSGSASEEKTETGHQLPQFCTRSECDSFVVIVIQDSRIGKSDYRTGKSDNRITG